MAKTLKEGAAYNQRDIVDILAEFSGFKDRVEKKFKDVAKELDGKANEHELWVGVYLIASDYADEQASRRKVIVDQIQKIS